MPIATRFALVRATSHGIFDDLGLNLLGWLGISYCWLSDCVPGHLAETFTKLIFLLI